MENVDFSKIRKFLEINKFFFNFIEEIQRLAEFEGDRGKKRKELERFLGDLRRIFDELNDGFLKLRFGVDGLKLRETIFREYGGNISRLRKVGVLEEGENFYVCRYPGFEGEKFVLPSVEEIWDELVRTGKILKVFEMKNIGLEPELVISPTGIDFQSLGEMIERAGMKVYFQNIKDEDLRYYPEKLLTSADTNELEIKGQSLSRNEFIRTTKGWESTIISMKPTMDEADKIGKSGKTYGEIIYRNGKDGNKNLHSVQAQMYHEEIEKSGLSGIWQVPYLFAQFARKVQGKPQLDENVHTLVVDSALVNSARLAYQGYLLSGAYFNWHTSKEDKYDFFTRVGVRVFEI